MRLLAAVPALFLAVLFAAEAGGPAVAFTLAAAATAVVSVAMVPRHS
jgi:hypothetical protein